jgi:peptidoglycan/LPS O-acetylase OafA/YrhL
MSSIGGADPTGRLSPVGNGLAGWAGRYSLPVHAPSLPPRESRPGEVLPLTGLRIVAALWVVLFHLRGNFWTDFPGVARYLNPILEHGDLGVDLFFALSGFVLTLNYADRMGNCLSGRSTVKFLWARLARVWPAYFVTLNVAALWQGALLATGSHNPVVPDEFSVGSYLRQALLVVLWTESDFDRLTWNGPAWSVSAEALVYVLFPVLVLLLPRLGRVLRVRQLLLLGTVAVFPAVFFVVVTGSLYYPSLWILRLLGAFISGCLACLVVRRIRRTVRTARIGSVAAAVIVLMVLTVFYVSHYVDRNLLASAVVVLFAPLLVALAISDGGLSRLLSTRVAVFGGHISYGVYLVHMLIIEPLWWSQTEWPWLLGPTTPLFRVLLLATPALACLGGYLLWRWVEEPSRRCMRSMLTPPSAVVSVSVMPAASQGAEQRNGVPSWSS